jgi:CBS domain-containing protein
VKVPDVMTIKDALTIMRHEQVLRLPVVNVDGVFQGMLSINDVVVDSEKETRRENENAEAFFTLVEQVKGGYTLVTSSEETPLAFDEKGHSPLERVFNEPEEIECRWEN